MTPAAARKVARGCKHLLLTVALKLCSSQARVLRGLTVPAHDARPEAPAQGPAPLFRGGLPLTHRHTPCKRHASPCATGARIGAGPPAPHLRQGMLYSAIRGPATRPMACSNHGRACGPAAANPRTFVLFCFVLFNDGATAIVGGGTRGKGITAKAKAGSAGPWRGASVPQRVKLS